jgi:hypothetical protein
MTLPMILAPLFVLVLMTFVIGIMLATVRTPLLTSGEVRPDAVSLRQPNWPPHALQFGYSFQNQFELPLLFYVLTILAIITKQADLVFVVLAWVFVLARVVHAVVHVTSNQLRQRFFAFAVSVLVLAIMWVIFIVRILIS